MPAAPNTAGRGRLHQQDAAALDSAFKATAYAARHELLEGAAVFVLARRRGARARLDARAVARAAAFVMERRRLARARRMKIHASRHARGDAAVRPP